MDFEQLTRIPVEGADVTLRPVFDPALHSYSVQIRRGEALFPIGLDGAFKAADEVMEAIDPELAKLGVRELTGEEAVLLYAGLVHAKGGADWVNLRQAVSRVVLGDTV
ncbi:hypothetical protein ACIGW7_40060 [Streptomyces sp. NPDC053253]|uniref:hypothetical protein n=1 Tax=Streptomyces sp. NPDC053253 TaxID=3365699 RepID=UPI0037D4E02B